MSSHRHTRCPAGASHATYHAGSRWRQRSCGDNTWMHDLLLIQADRASCDSLAANECLPVHRCDGTRIVRIRVVDVCDVIDRVVVIDPGDFCLIVVARAASIDFLDVSRTGAIRGNINVTRPQWIPADALYAAERDGNSKSASTDEPNKSRCVHGRDCHWPRHPAPRAVNHCPSAVVKRREAPRLGVNPSPAPRGDPTPMARVVGNPAGRHVVRHPVVAIFGIRVP